MGCYIDEEVFIDVALIGSVVDRKLDYYDSRDITPEDCFDKIRSKGLMYAGL